MSHLIQKLKIKLFFKINCNFGTILDFFKYLAIILHQSHFNQVMCLSMDDQIAN